MKASIVILNWNGGADTCLEAVASAAAQDYINKEIIFVDNSSSDGSYEAVQHSWPDLIYVQTGSNLGCPAGRNAGAIVANGDLIFFMENDGVWSHDDVISQAVDVFKKNPKLGALYTAVVGYKTGLADAPVDGHTRIKYAQGLYLASTFRGGASAIRSELFKEIGMFPDDFFRQYEENYVALLIYERGYNIAYWPARALRHKGSDYPGKSTTVLKYNIINELKTICRIYPAFIFPFFFVVKLFISISRVFFSPSRAEIPRLISSINRTRFSQHRCTRVKSSTIFRWIIFRHFYSKSLLTRPRSSTNNTQL